MSWQANKDNFILKTPVVLTVFNRPELTQKIFEVIRLVKPSSLYLIADGPRPDHSSDEEKCMATRAILEQVDWDCQVTKNFSDENLGCGPRLSMGISWVFEQEEEAIILEDDCLPHPSFFRFCQEVIERYRDDERIMMISGTNTLGRWKSTSQSYHFSQYGAIWGWATWRRAWRHFDYNIELWAQSEVRERLKDVILDEQDYKFRAALYSQLSSGKAANTWDYQWAFARFVQSGLTVIPAVNLVANIGFGDDATHTKKSSSGVSLSTGPFPFPIKYNPFTIVDRDYDREYLKTKWKGKKQNNILTGLKNCVTMKLNRIATHLSVNVKNTCKEIF